MKTRSFLLSRRLLPALAVSMASMAAVWAHIPQYGVGTVCEIKFREDRLHFVYDLSYDGIWAQAEMLGMDKNKNSLVDKDEAVAYLERQWSQKISKHVRILVDGREASIRKTGGRYDGLEGEIFGVPFSLFYDLEIELPGGRCAPGRWYTLEVHDTVVKDETPAKPIYRVPYEGHGDETSRFRCDFPKPQLAILDATSYVVQDYKVQVRFLFDAIDANPLEGTGADPGLQAASEDGPRVAVEERSPRDAAREEHHAESGDSEYSKKLEESVRNYDELGWGAIFTLFLFALAWGAGHALTPGHGKSMVAAYLIGTQGRIRDAFILGLVTTITHTGSVFLFGAGVYLLINASTVASAGHLQNLIIVGAQLVSGLMLAVMGLVLFFRRMRGVPPGHDHSHGHGHGHSHTHSHGGGQPHEHEHEHGHAHQHEHAEDARSHPHELADDKREEPAHDHSHAHEHPHARGHDGVERDEHAHTHAHEDASAGLLRGGSPRLWDLLALGFSGGLVPCPAGLTVIIIGLQYPHKLAFTLLLLVFFSIGLGAVLVAIGVLLITGKALAGDRGRGGAFFQELEFLRRVFPRPFLETLDRQGMKILRIVPAASCLFIAGLGAFFLVRTSIVGKTEIIAMLRLVADWME